MFQFPQNIPQKIINKNLQIDNNIVYCTLITNKSKIKQS